MVALSVAHPVIHPACRLIEVHDGDTMHIDIDMHYRSVHMADKVRLAHIDTPELATAAGTLAKSFAVNWFADRADVVTVTTFETKNGDTISDNYGRPLVVLSDTAGQTLNQALIDSGNARAYEGGKR